MPPLGDPLPDGQPPGAVRMGDDSPDVGGSLSDAGFSLAEHYVSFTTQARGKRPDSFYGARKHIERWWEMLLTR